MEFSDPSAPLCSSSGKVNATANKAVITLVTPPARPGTDGDLELLEASTWHLELKGAAGRGSVEVRETRRGTSIPSGPDAKGSQKGAAYVFSSADDDGKGLAGAWQQQAKLFLPNGGEADRFGWCVVVSGAGDSIAVSAPGEASEAGAVYVFERSGGGRYQDAPENANWGFGEWRLSQRLDGSVFSFEPQDKFGESLAWSADGNTLVVGSPGYRDKQGAAYVFIRQGYSNLFEVHDQLILGPRALKAAYG